jgi:hypothetical protein
MILSAAILLRYSKRPEHAARIENAERTVLRNGTGAKDLMDFEAQIVRENGECIETNIAWPSSFNEASALMLRRPIGARHSQLQWDLSTGAEEGGNASGGATA